jgi:4'-phosphopantetheinyl transferase
MAERCLSPREFAAFRALAHSEQQPAFFRCWVRKEAYVKGLGQGMRIPLDAFEVSFLAHEPARLERRWEGDASQQGWFFQELEMGDDYAAAVAVEGELMRVFCWDWRF